MPDEGQRHDQRDACVGSTSALWHHVYWASEEHGVEVNLQHMVVLLPRFDDVERAVLAAKAAKEAAVAAVREEAAAWQATVA